MSLVAKQGQFVQMIAKLVDFAFSKGYVLTYGEAYRPPELAKMYEQKGIGIANSLHTIRLAVDFNVFKEGAHLTSGDEFTDLGEFWEQIGGTWGGRFEDGNHFSLSHNGVR